MFHSFLFLLAASLILNRLTIAAAARIGLIDAPSSPRKHQSQPVPRGAGLPIFITFFTGLAIIEWQTGMLTAGDISSYQLIGFAFAALIIVIGGLLDDIFELQPREAILSPILGTLVLLSFGVGVSKVTNPLGGFVEISQLFSDFVTFAWVLVISYSMKLVDGVDGIAGGLSASAGVVIALLAGSAAFFQPDVQIISLAFVATVLGFLFWNLHPAKLYLGESGSVLLGFIIAVLAVLSGSKLLTAMLVLAIPLVDIISVLLRRKLDGVSLFTGDRRHFHHMLFDKGWPESSILALYLALSLALGLLTLVLTSWQKLVLIAIIGSAFIAITISSYAKRTS
jgi:UDP-GlcNAc:undecaprenyl-phosphate GlcNAc-1-phosphate transferase